VIRRGAAVVVFVGAFVFLSSGIRVGPEGDQPPFDIDEASKLSESYYYHLFFETLAWRHPDWHEDFYARMNPPVAKYVFGAALAAAGLHVHDRRLQEQFERLWRTPSLLRREVPDDMLRVTRRTSAVYGALIVAVLVGVGWSVAGPLAGGLAGLLVLTNPGFVGNARSGLTDSILLFHLTLMLPITLWAARSVRASHSWARTSTWAVLAPGVAIALATGSKMNGALTGPVYCLGLLAAAVVEPGPLGRGRQLVRSLLASGLTALVAVGVLVALDPTLHDGPVTRLFDAFTVFGDWMAKQQIDPGPALLDTRSRVAFVGFFTLRAPSLALPRLAGSLGGNLMILGSCLGLVRLAARLRVAASLEREAVSRPSAGDAAVLLCWIVGVLAGVTLWIPVAWDRYVLPPSLAVDLSVAVGLAAVPLVLRPPGFRRRALLAGAAAGLGILVWWAADPVWVNPRMMPGLRDPAVQQAYLDAAHDRPRSITLQENAGVLWLLRRRGGEATERFAAALGLIPPAEQAARSAALRRCTLQLALVRSRALVRDLPGAYEAALAYLAALAEVRATLHSGDPLVLAAFDQLATEGATVASGLRSQLERP
jgi:hypothetical protein